MVDLDSDVLLVNKELLLGLIRREDFGNTTEKFEVNEVAEEITVDRTELRSIEALGFEVADVKCPTDVLAINGVTVVALGSADVILGVATDTFCVVICVVFNSNVLSERSLLEKNAGDELSATVLLEIVLIASALVTGDVVFCDLLGVDEMLAFTERLEKLS